MKTSKQAGRLIFSLLLPLLLWQCAGTGSGRPELQEEVGSRSLRIDSTLQDNAAMEQLIDPFRAKMEATMDAVIGHASVDLKRGKPEAPLNNFVADLMLKRANREFDKKVDVAITNTGGLRTDIMKGPVTLRRIYELMPFENELVVLEMNGSQLLTLARQIGEVYGEPIAGMHLEFLDKKLAKAEVGGAKVADDSLYYVVTTDYLSSPAYRKLSMLSGVPRTFLDVRLRDAILDEVKAREAAGESISARVEGRLIFRESPGSQPREG